MQFLFLDSFKRIISQNTFAHLEEAFDRVPPKVLWWALYVAGVPEWLVKVVQALHVSARSRTHANSSFSEEFEVKVGEHQGSVLSPLLFIIVLEALSCEICVGCPQGNVLCRSGFFS